MRYLIIPIFFITSTCFASIEDVRERIISCAWWAEYDAREYYIMGDKTLCQYYLGKATAYQYCLELIDEDMKKKEFDYDTGDVDPDFYNEGLIEVDGHVHRIILTEHHESCPCLKEK